MWKIVSVGILCLYLGACGTTNLSPAASGLSNGIVPPNGDTAAKSASAGPTDLLPAPRLHSPHNPVGIRSVAHLCAGDGGSAQDPVREDEAGRTGPAGDCAATAASLFAGGGETGRNRPRR